MNHFKIKTSRFLLEIYIFVRYISSVSNEGLFFDFKDVKNSILNSEIGKKYFVENNSIKIKINGDKLNINCLFDFDEVSKKNFISKDLFYFFKNIKLTDEKNNTYFVFNSEKELCFFKNLLNIISINKSIYITKKGFIKLLIKDLLDKNIIRELPKKVSNKPNLYFGGSVGVNSKLYEEIIGDKKRIEDNKFYIHYKDIFNENYILKNKKEIIENIINKVEKNEMIRLSKSHKLISEEEIRNVIKEIIIKKFFN